jgi:hypothetical protein
MKRTDLPPLPERMRGLPVSERGYPVPWFVRRMEDGKYDFRVVRHDGPRIAHRQQLCWLCGQRRGRVGAFTIGPMCAVNRVSAEPPSHLSCAKYAVRACPFLTRPMAKRNNHGLPDDTRETGGIMIERNPGVALIWVTDTYEAVSTHQGEGVIFSLGPPMSVSWWAEGRPATTEEVLASIRSGLPILQKMADEEGADACAELAVMLAKAMLLVPQQRGTS